MRRCWVVVRGKSSIFKTASLECAASAMAMSSPRMVQPDDECQHDNGRFSMSFHLEIKVEAFNLLDKYGG